MRSNASLKKRTAGTPATIPGPSAAMRAAMLAMHVVVWAVSVGVLATLARRPQERSTG